LAPKSKHGDLLRPDGKSTQGLRELITHSLKEVQESIVEPQPSISSIAKNSIFYDNPIASGFLDFNEESQNFATPYCKEKGKQGRKKTKRETRLERLTTKQIPKNDTCNSFKLFEQMLDAKYG